LSRFQAVCYVDSMRFVFIFFWFLISVVFTATLALAMSCAPSFRVLMECDEVTCSKGFIVLITDGICENPYRFEEATPEGLKKLYDTEAVDDWDFAPSVLDFSSRKPKEKGIFERGDHYERNGATDFFDTVNTPQKTDFKTLEEARQYWLSKKFMSSIFSWFWFCVDAVIFFIAVITLYLSVKDFKVKYLYREKTEKHPVKWQIFVWVCSWLFLIQVIGLYQVRLTALLFLIVPTIWIGEILALAVYALRRKFDQKGSGSPPARG
jgi:hypothetical protein